MVVLVEDIHWAEPALLDLLEAILDWSQGVPILLLCPSRPELIESRADWGAGRPTAAVLHLEPLDASLASELIDVLPGGSALPANLRHQIVETAEGNPLFVEEFLAMLVDEGHLRAGANGSWTAAESLGDVPVPTSISLLMAARLDSLEPADRRVAEQAWSSAGFSSVVRSLSYHHKRNVAHLAADLLSLTRRQVIRPDAPGLDGDDAFRFRHVLIRDAAYEALTKAERADLHERFARWLERVTGERLTEYAEIYAYHLAQAVEYRLELGALDDLLAAGAVQASIKAAERSEQLHAYRNALRLYRSAIHLIGLASTEAPVFDLGDLLSRGAEAAAYEADATSALAMLTSALSIADAEGDMERCASLHARVARELYEHGDTTGAERHIERAVAVIPDGAAAASRGAVLADVGRLLMIMTRFEESLEACEQVVSMGAAVEPRAQARALTTIGAVLGQTGRVDEALPRFEEARRVAIEAGDGYELGHYYGNLAIALSFDDQSAEGPRGGARGHRCHGSLRARTVDGRIAEAQPGRRRDLDRPSSRSAAAHPGQHRPRRQFDRCCGRSGHSRRRIVIAWRPRGLCRRIRLGAHRDSSRESHHGGGRSHVESRGRGRLDRRSRAKPGRASRPG